MMVSMMGFGSYLGYGAISALLGAVAYSNLPTSITLGSTAPTVDYLAETKLKYIAPGKNIMEARDITAGELFRRNSPLLIMAVRRPGCSFCRNEATKISKIAPQLKEKNVSIVGVVHEMLGVEDFRPFLKDADIYYDPEKRFYGPKERWMQIWMGFLRVSTYVNYYKTKKAGVAGNTEGEGRLLGGVYLINNKKMVFSHLEKEWGDAVDPEKIVEALKKL